MEKMNHKKDGNDFIICEVKDYFFCKEKNLNGKSLYEKETSIKTHTLSQTFVKRSIFIFLKNKDIGEKEEIKEKKEKERERS